MSKFKFPFLRNRLFVTLSLSLFLFVTAFLMVRFKFQPTPRADEVNQFITNSAHVSFCSGTPSVCTTDTSNTVTTQILTNTPPPSPIPTSSSTLSPTTDPSSIPSTSPTTNPTSIPTTASTSSPTASPSLGFSLTVKKDNNQGAIIDSQSGLLTVVDANERGIDSITSLAVVGGVIQVPSDHVSKLQAGTTIKLQFPGYLIIQHKLSSTDMTAGEVTIANAIPGDFLNKGSTVMTLSDIAVYISYYRTGTMPSGSTVTEERSLTGLARLIAHYRQYH